MRYQNSKKSRTLCSRLSDGSSIIEVTAEEAISKGLIPNKLITYYLALLMEFYDKTGIDIKRSRFRNLSDRLKGILRICCI